MARIKKQKRALYARGWRPTHPRDRTPWQHPTPPPDLLADAERAVARVRPKWVRRRVISLFRWAGDSAPGLLEPRLRPGLLNLAGRSWREPLDRLSPVDQGVLGVVQHLLWTFPTSPMWAQPFDAEAPTDARTRRVLGELSALVGCGGGLREARRAGLLPRRFSRRMFHSLMSASPWTPIMLAYRRAQVRGLDGPDWLAPVLVHAGLDSLEHDEPRWLDNIAWFIQREVQREHLLLLVVYLRAHPAPLRGRGLDAALEDALEWRLGNQARVQTRRRFRPLGFGDRPPEQIEEGATWSAHELRSYMALWKEGRALRHCVATYAGWAASGHSSLWSLRRDEQRTLTIEIQPRNRRIVQVRGRHNRPPTDVEWAVVRSWAQANAMEINN